MTFKQRLLTNWTWNWVKNCCGYTSFYSTMKLSEKLLWVYFFSFRYYQHGLCYCFNLVPLFKKTKQFSNPTCTLRLCFLVLLTVVTCCFKPAFTTSQLLCLLKVQSSGQKGFCKFIFWRKKNPWRKPHVLSKFIWQSSSFSSVLHTHTHTLSPSTCSHHIRIVDQASCFLQGSMKDMMARFCNVWHNVLMVVSSSPTG